MSTLLINIVDFGIVSVDILLTLMSKFFVVFWPSLMTNLGVGVFWPPPTTNLGVTEAPHGPWGRFGQFQGPNLKPNGGDRATLILPLGGGCVIPRSTLGVAHATPYFLWSGLLATLFFLNNNKKKKI
jgi:hypothetical protein